MKTPNITPAQILAKLAAIGGQCVAWGLLSGHTEQLAVSAASIVLPVGWMLADALIRHGRSRVAAVQALEQIAVEIAAGKTATAPSPPPA